MCGIGGVRRYGDTPIDLDMIQGLGCQLEKRGNHATGVALATGGKVYVFKRPIPAWEFFLDKEYEDFMKQWFRPETETVLIHTRAATVGNPIHNPNNHPLTLGKTAVVHNGGIFNHEDIFRRHKWVRSAETDSDAIRAVLDNQGGLTEDGMRALNQLRGGAAIAAISPDHPGKLLIGRSSNPLVLGYDPETKIMAFASMKDMLYVASKPVKKALNMWFQSNRTSMMFFEVPDNTSYLFGPEGMEFHAEFKTAQYTSNPVRYDVRGSYSDRMGQFEEEEARRTQRLALAAAPAAVEELPDAFKCKNLTCPKWIQIPKNMKHLPLWKFHCRTCGTYLAEEPTS
jgi:asparagine synthetase B (glutamine-hydrolysing)